MRGRSSSASARPAGAASAAPTLLRLDFAGAGARARRETRPWQLVLGAALAVALLLAALRVEIQRTRYQLADHLRTETSLLHEQRELTVRVRRLRDPARLGLQAEQRGMVRPDRLIDLPMEPLPSPVGNRP